MTLKFKGYKKNMEIYNTPKKLDKPLIDDDRSNQAKAQKQAFA